MDSYFDRYGTLKEGKEKITLPTMGIVMSMLFQRIIKNSKGGVRVCIDMTKDTGTVIDKEKLCP
jgi:hypothetical protein